jgi:hypothetical protein
LGGAHSNSASRHCNILGAVVVAAHTLSLVTLVVSVRSITPVTRTITITKTITNNRTTPLVVWILKTLINACD